VDGKIVCEMRRKDGVFVSGEICDMGEEGGKIVRA
jgi:hypothetical protein